MSRPQLRASGLCGGTTVRLIPVYPAGPSRQAVAENRLRGEGATRKRPRDAPTSGAWTKGVAPTASTNPNGGRRASTSPPSSTSRCPERPSERRGAAVSRPRAATMGVRARREGGDVMGPGDRSRDREGRHPLLPRKRVEQPRPQADPQDVPHARRCEGVEAGRLRSGQEGRGDLHPEARRRAGWRERSANRPMGAATPDNPQPLRGTPVQPLRLLRRCGSDRRALAPQARFRACRHSRRT
jgi:hypothetical protein